jgi:hypothetical protein
VLGTADLVDGKATLEVTAEYQGDASNLASSSEAVTLQGRQFLIMVLAYS